MVDRQGPPVDEGREEAVMIRPLTKSPRRARRVAVYFYAAARRRGLSERSQWFACYAEKGAHLRPECVAIYEIKAETADAAIAQALAKAKSDGVAVRAHLY